MRGNAHYYQRKTLNQRKQLKKLHRVKNKYLRKLEDIMNEIESKEQYLSDNVHCLSLIYADSEDSVIID